MGGGGVPGPASGNDDQTGSGAIGQSGADTPGPEAANEGVTQDVTMEGWPRSLRWREFQQVQSRPDGENEDAMVAPVTSPGQARLFRQGGQWRVAELTLEVDIRDQSWVVRSQKSADLLKHEQGHYDIHCIIVGRDLVDPIKGLRARSQGRLAAALRRLLQRAQRRAQRMTDQYDRDTNHGLNEERQAAWDQQFSNARANNVPLTAPD